MSRRSSRVQGLHAQEDGDEVNPRNQAPLNVALEAPENGHLPPPPPRAPSPIDLAAILQQQNQLLQILVTTLTAQAQGNLGNNRLQFIIMAMAAELQNSTACSHLSLEDLITLLRQMIGCERLN